MSKYLRKNTAKGEASIVFVFVILTIVLMSAITISIISISTIYGAKSGEDSALALYAADTGLERATYEYWWGAAVGADKDVRCATNGWNYTSALNGSWSSTIFNNQFIYSIIINDGTENGTAPSSDNCPDPDAVRNSTDELCIGVTGRQRDAKSRSLERKISSSSGLNGGVACADVYK